VQHPNQGEKGELKMKKKYAGAGDVRDNQKQQGYKIKCKVRDRGLAGW